MNVNNISLPPTRMIFFDDFSAPRLDRSKWNVIISGSTVNNEQQAYVDSGETISILRPAETAGVDSGGALVIQPRFREDFRTAAGNVFDFISGRIDTRDKFSFRYGTAEARMRLPAGSGLWPAFWLMGSGKWPKNGEIDIMENIGDPAWTSAGVHGPGFAGENGLINHFYFQEGTDITSWHIYGVEWTPDQLLFKLDGKLVFRVTADMVNFHGRWVFDNPKYLILNLALGGIYPYKINAVESPYYGLPQSTVEEIKQERAKLMVDWVKVSELP